MVELKLSVLQGWKVVHSYSDNNSGDAAIGKEPSRVSVRMHGEFYGRVVKITVNNADWLQQDPEQLLPAIFQVIVKAIAAVDWTFLREQSRLRGAVMREQFL